MSATTPAAEVATIVLPVVRGKDSKNTVRFFEMLVDGKPHAVDPGGASIWRWREQLVLAGLDFDKVQHATVTIEFTRSKPGTLINGKPIAKPKPKVPAKAKGNKAA